MASLERDGDVFVLNLGDAENRFNAESLDALEDHLDEVEAAPPPRALVSTASGKYWGLGLDLEWMATQGEEAAVFLARVHELLARTLELAVPSVAALQGHTFAAGAMFALAHDQRVMRADRGYFCLPEIDISLPFTPGMSALIAARLPNRTAHEAMTTGRRYGGTAAAEAWIVDEAVDEAEVMPRALARAEGLAGKDPGTLKAMKRTLYREILEALRAAPAVTGDQLAALGGAEG
jgi:enoyl-CoA hydratase/carnithine racemase